MLAQDIYDALSQRGYRVFFSRISLEDKLGSLYEPYIFSALNSAKVMLAVGTDYEYINAVWVKNEWKRFTKIMAKDKTKVLIPCYRDMDPYDMPEELKAFQSQDCGKIGFMQDLVRGIDKLFGKSQGKNEKDASSSGGRATVESLISRVFLFLEDGEWDEANKYCERVLDIDPKSAEAYLGKLMAEMHVNARNQLGACTESFEEKSNYKKVLRFGDDKIKAEMQGYIEQINERREEARLVNIYEDALNAMNVAGSEEEYKALADSLKKIKGFRDADSLAEKCIEKADACRRKNEENAEKINQMAEAVKASFEKKIIEDEIKNLQNARSSLGIFAGKEKKEVDRKIAELTQNSKEIDENNKTGYELSIEKAFELLKDSKVKLKVIAKYYYLYSKFSETIELEFGAYTQGKKNQGKTAITWKILAKDNGKILLLSDKALACQPYNNSSNEVTWENCSLRKWLNSTFLNDAFSPEEQRKIINSNVTADENPNFITDQGSDTIDKIFLLSCREAEKYFSSKDERKCVPTINALVKGAYSSGMSPKNGEETCYWWLRTPGAHPDYAAHVDLGGNIHYIGNDVDTDDECVRPAMWVELE